MRWGRQVNWDTNVRWRLLIGRCVIVLKRCSTSYHVGCLTVGIDETHFPLENGKHFDETWAHDTSHKQRQSVKLYKIRLGKTPFHKTVKDPCKFHP